MLALSFGERSAVALKVVTMAELRIEVLLEVERTGLTVSGRTRP